MKYLSLSYILLSIFNHTKLFIQVELLLTEAYGFEPMKEEVDCKISHSKFICSRFHGRI